MIDRADLPRKFQHDVATPDGCSQPADACDRQDFDPAPRMTIGSGRALLPRTSALAALGSEPVRANWLDPDALPMLPVNGIDLRDFMTRLERNLIQQALDDSNCVVAHAADRLHIRRTTLVEKMRKYGLGRADVIEQALAHADVLDAGELN